VNKSGKVIGIVLLSLFITILLYFRFEYFFQSKTLVIDPWGDGYKTYFAIDFHMRHDSSYLHFEGMNYPYGEHVIPAATHPVLSNSWRFIHQNITDLSGKVFRLVHWSLYLSFLIGAVFLFLIFDKLKLPAWYALLAAIGISFLNPQFLRLVGHYGLAHMAVLPMLLYFLMRHTERPNWKNSLAIALIVSFFSLIHFYFFAIQAFTITLYFLFQFLLKKGWKRIPHYLFHYTLQILLPLAFFSTILIFNDPITDRSNSPYGFFVFRAFPPGIFSSIYQPHMEWLNRSLPKMRDFNIESSSYIGLVALLSVPFLLVSFFIKLFKKQISGGKFELIAALTAICLLLFSIAFPFTIPACEKWVDHLGPLKQFRSLGRFAWVFFMVINVLAFSFLYHSLKARGYWKLLFIPAFALLFWEAYHNAYAVDLGPDPIEEYEKPKKAFDQIKEIDFTKYQAILPIPYYNIGSDNFWWEKDGMLGQKSQTLSMQTGLPLTAAMLTRNSFSQTYKQLQLVTEPYRSPEILKDYPDDRPLIMLLNEYALNKQARSFQYLLEGRKPIFQKSQAILYELPLASFEERIKEKKKKIFEELLEEKLFSHGNLLARDSLANFVYEDFDGLKSSKHYFSNSGYEGDMNSENILFEGSLPAQQTGDYVLSFWAFVHQDLYPRSWVKFSEIDLDSGQELQQMNFQLSEKLIVMDPNGWALWEMPFKLMAANSKIRLTVRNIELEKKPLWVDELLIRPVENHIYQKGENFIWKNNRLFPLN